MAFSLYLALGDSLSVDKFAGPGLGAASLLYQNRDDRWPEFRGRDLKSRFPGIAFHNLATDGHTTGDVAAQTWPTPGGPALITLTVGGNDLIACLNRGSLDPTPVVGSISRLVDRLHQRYPESTLMLATVYDPTDGTGQVQSGHRRFAPGMAAFRDFNARLGRLPVTLVDVHAHFLGHGMRHDDATYEHHHPDDPTFWYTLDIEPNARGSSEIRRLFWEALP